MKKILTILIIIAVVAIAISGLAVVGRRIIN